MKKEKNIDTKTNEEIEIIIKNKKIEEEDKNTNSVYKVENTVKNEINNIEDNTVSDKKFLMHDKKIILL